MPDNKFYSEWGNLNDYFILLEKIHSSKISIYQSKEWLLLIKDSFNLEIKSIISYKNNKVCAISTFSFLRKGFFTFLGSPLKGTFTHRGGPIFIDEIDQSDKYKVIKSIEDKLGRFSFYVEWSPNIQENINNISKKYFILKNQTLLINLSQDEIDLWNSFQSRARNMIRKAEKCGLKAKIIKPSNDWLEDFYFLLKQVYKKQKRNPPHPLNFYLNLKSLKDNQICCIEVKKGKEIIAAGIFIIDNNNLYFLSGASNITGNKLSAPSLIQWTAMKNFINKVNTYDMGGIGIPSIDKFKKSFGGEIYTYKRIIRKNIIFKIFEFLMIFIKKYFL